MKEKYIPALIAFAQQWPEDAWAQDAGPGGKAICSGCRCFVPVVYDLMLQWCEDCYSYAAPESKDTQPSGWSARRRGQGRDYGWTPLSPSTGNAKP